MAPQKQGFARRKLSFAEIFIIVLFVALLGGVGYAAYVGYEDLRVHREVEAAWPVIVEGARKQRDAISAAIDAYASNFGVYPPDHVISRRPLIVDPITNSLLYELGGTVFDPMTQSYANQSVAQIGKDGLQAAFQTEALTNVVSAPGPARRFLAIEGFSFFDLHDDPDVASLQLPVFLDGVTPDAAWEFLTSPWMYVRSNATNNPGRYDLWMTVRTRDRQVLIGNWPSAR